MTTPDLVLLAEGRVAEWNAARGGADRLHALQAARRGITTGAVMPWDVDARGANLWQARLDGVDLSWSVCENAEFSGASLRGAMFDRARAVGARLSHARLEGAVFFKANFSNGNLHGADLRGADLREAQFERADLGGADLRGADLRSAKLEGTVLDAADLRGADLRNAAFGDANLYRADLRECQLGHAFLYKAYLRAANLEGARLGTAMLEDANLREADLRGADLAGANIRYATLVHTKVDGADFTGAHVFGISAWQLDGVPASMRDLNIAGTYDPPLRIDDLEVAQFVYLLLNNPKIRQVLDTVTAKMVLILGRFTPERKRVLDALRDRLRTHGLVPVIFDFDPSASRNLTETISTLAHLSRFVIADLTDARSLPQELQRIVPGNPSLPVQPIILDAQFAHAMFDDFLDYPWVLTPFRYRTIDHLLEVLEEQVIGPAVRTQAEIAERRERRRAR